MGPCAFVATGAVVIGCSAGSLDSKAPSDGGDAGSARDAVINTEGGDDRATRDAGADRAGTDAATCAPAGPSEAPAPSTVCAAASVTFDPATLCSGAAVCPVEAFYRLTGNGGGGAYPTIAAVGTAGASVLVESLDGARSCLYTMAPGATPEAEELPSLSPGSVLTGVRGAPTIVTGLAGGLGYLQGTPSGWVEDAVPGLSGYLSAVAIGAPNGDLFALYGQGSNGFTIPPGGLASFHGGCWQVADLPGDSISTFTSIDLDAANRPWFAAEYDGTLPSGQYGSTLKVFGPDLTSYDVVSSVSLESGRHQPIVLAGGVSAAGGYPMVVSQAYDGTYLFQPSGSAPTWTAQPIPGSKKTIASDNCPYTEVTAPAGGCGALTSCVHGIDGPTPGLAAARTASGKTFIAKGESVGGLTTYSLSCFYFEPQVPSCGCSMTLVSSQGSGAIVLTRVDTGAPTEVLRLSFATSAQLDAYDMTMVARGDTLLLVANEEVRVGAPEVAYFEIDTTDL
jgi:hypothetical protein